MDICPVCAEDQQALEILLRTVVDAGESYAFDQQRPTKDLYAYWVAPEKHTYAARVGGVLAGSFYIKANQPDRGNHIANAGYMVSPIFRGQGIGEQLGRFSMEEARSLGYTAMQFNFVLSTNLTALRLWKKLGFSICGVIPKAFRHQHKGFIPAYIMYCEL